MRTPRLGRALTGALLLAALAGPPLAHADTATPDVRIEGLNTTLFEGPVTTQGHDVRASSDTDDRPCDGTNNGAHDTPGATPTGASVDAMTIAGMDFDGDWYPGFDDYFITQWGPDHENWDNLQSWGILVNGAFTPVGGCQYQVQTGDRVLWSIDAFTGHPFLDLLADTGNGPAETATATTSVGVPLTVKVTGTTDGPSPTAAAQAGAIVAPVTTAPNGIETAHQSSPDAVSTNGDGLAQLVFDTPGWHRVKAVGPDLIRSPRLDVCVLGGGMTDCGAAPWDTQARSVDGDHTPPAQTTTVTQTVTTTVPGPTTTVTGPGTTVTVPDATAPLRVGPPALTTAGRAAGKVGVRWTVADPGPGVRGWAIAASDESAAKAAWRTVATGTTATSASLKLGAGRAWKLRLTVTDARGAETTTAIGSAFVPLDDRALKVRGRHAATADRSAWRRTVTSLRRGASFAVRLAQGEPVLVLRGGRATVRVTAGGRRSTYRVTGAGEIPAPARPAGTVTVRVTAGTLRLDGVGVRP